MTAITLKNVCIIFGKKNGQFTALADQGKSRSDIQAETGHVLGVHNCSITIAEGEIVVLMASAPANQRSCAPSTASTRSPAAPSSFTTKAGC